MKRASLVLAAAGALLLVTPASAQEQRAMPPSLDEEAPSVSHALGLPDWVTDPFAVASSDGGLHSELRAIVLTPRSIRLVRAGLPIGETPFEAVGPVRFEDVAATVADPAWISVVRPGVYELHAAFVQEPGTELVVAGPAVAELRMVSDPGVFVGGRGATARFEQTHVTSWNPETEVPSSHTGAPRPFVLYQDRSRLDVIDSEMAYLGSDRPGAYGVTWRYGATTGRVLRSRFHHGFYGAHTLGTQGMVFEQNVFADNVFYGSGPHLYSSEMRIEENQAFGNGSHGFFASGFVTDSVLARNHSHGNGGNGIVLDDHSDRNRVAENRVEENAKDGIVVDASSDVTLTANEVSAHRLGIRWGSGSRGLRLVRNQLDGNSVGIRLAPGTTGATLVDNVVLGSVEAGVVVAARDTTLHGGRVAEGSIGIDVRVPVGIRGVAIADVEDGLLIRAGGDATLRHLEVAGGAAGVRVAAGGRATLSYSTVRARRPLLGPVAAPVLGRPGANTLTAPPVARSFAWRFVAIGLIVVLAAALELLRGRHDPLGRTKVPASILNLDSPVGSQARDVRAA